MMGNKPMPSVRRFMLLIAALAACALSSGCAARITSPSIKLDPSAEGIPKITFLKECIDASSALPAGEYATKNPDGGVVVSVYRGYKEDFYQSMRELGKGLFDENGANPLRLSRVRLICEPPTGNEVISDFSIVAGGVLSTFMPLISLIPIKANFYYSVEYEVTDRAGTKVLSKHFSDIVSGKVNAWSLGYVEAATALVKKLGESVPKNSAAWVVADLRGNAGVLSVAANKYRGLAKTKAQATDQVAYDAAVKAMGELKLERAKAGFIQAAASKYLSDDIRNNARAKLALLGEIDWSMGKPQLAPYVEAGIRIVPVVQEQGKIERIGLEVTARNTGKGAVYQLLGQTRSTVKEWNGKSVLFGKIEPGETKARGLVLPVPKSLETGRYNVEIAFEELNRNEPLPITVALDMESLARPSLAWTYEIVDDPTRAAKVVGNADGVLQKGEAVDIVFTVKNTGTAVARAAKLKIGLPKDDSLVIYGRTTLELGDIPVQGIAQRALNVQVKNWSKLKELPLKIELAEENFSLRKHDTARLAFDTRIPKRPIALNRKMWVKVSEAVLLQGASAQAREYARAPRGSQLDVIGELPGWMQVELQVREQGKMATRRVWVQAADLTAQRPAAVAVGTAAPAEAVVVTRWGNVAPSITFVTPSSDFTTGDDCVRLLVSVIDADGTLKSVRLLAGPDAKNTRGLKVQRVTTQASEAGKRGDSRVLEHLLMLDYGPTIVRVEAEDEGGAKAAKTLTITRQRKLGKTHLLAVGINTYPGQYRLKCARRDAEAFAAFAMDQLGMAKKNIKILLDNDATERELRKSFGVLRKEVKAEDTMLVFLAGHGVSDEESNCYFLMSDSEMNNLFGTAVGMDEFRRMLKGIKAERLLVIADVCYSRNIALPGQRAAGQLRSGSSEKLFASMEGKGCLLIGYDGPGREDEKLGHGYLTAFLLEGLKGPGDLDKDGRITVRELKDYAAKRAKASPGGGKVWIKGEGDMTFIKLPGL